MSQQINSWIFGDLLEGSSHHSHSEEWMFPQPVISARVDADEDDGLMVSSATLKVIELPVRKVQPSLDRNSDRNSDRTSSSETTDGNSLPLDWLSQPLSGRGLARTVNALIVFAALLVFVLVFLSVNQEAPRWPFAMTIGAVILVAAMYWGFFQLFGGGNFGQRLARMTGSDADEEEDMDARFR
jgi:hypothetical protein